MMWGGESSFAGRLGDADTGKVLLLHSWLAIELFMSGAENAGR